jgi:hypothetical protein
LNVNQVESFPIDSVKQCRFDVNTQLMSNSRQVKQGIGRTGQSGMDFDGVYKG